MSRKAAKPEANTSGINQNTNNMNKHEIRDLKQAAMILEGNGYEVIAKELSEIINSNENKEPKKLADRFFSDQLAKDIEAGRFDKSEEYTYSVEHDRANGDFTLTIYNAIELIEEYQNYTDTDEAKQDVSEMEAEGFQIIEA